MRGADPAETASPKVCSYSAVNTPQDSPNSLVQSYEWISCPRSGNAYPIHSEGHAIGILRCKRAPSVPRADSKECSP
jgi:hypothetical protein